MGDASHCTVQQLEALAESDTEAYIAALNHDYYLCFFTAVFFHPLGIYFIAKSTAFPPRLKIWMLLYYIADYMYLISFIITQRRHLDDRSGDHAKQGCDLLVPASTCIYLRIWQSLRIVFAHYFLIIVNIDFQLEYFCRWYRQCRGGSCFLAFLLIVGVFFDVYPSIPVELASIEMMVNCASFESKPRDVQFKHIFLPLLVGDGIGFVVHAAWYIYQYPRFRTPKYQLNAKDRLYFNNANNTFKITLPLFLFNVFSNLYHDFMSTVTSIDGKISAAQFVALNTTPLCILASALLMLVILHALAKPNLYRQIFFGRKWLGVICCRANSAIVRPTPVTSVSGTESTPLRSTNWTGRMYSRHM